MSMWFRLMANGNEVGLMEIRRITNTGPGDLHPDVVSTYVVTQDGRKLGFVEHRYGDGAWALVRAALGVTDEPS